MASTATEAFEELVQRSGAPEKYLLSNKPLILASQSADDADAP